MEDKIYENFVVELIPKQPEPEDNSQIEDENNPQTAEPKTENTDKSEDFSDSQIKKETNSQTEGTSENIKKTPVEMHVVVNKQPITLTEKSDYVFVDVFDFYPFDLSQVRGKRLVTNLDGQHAEFVGMLHEGAVIDIY